MVVESASALQLAGHNFYKLEDCDHMHVCKPPNQSHPSYSILLQVLRLCSKGLDPPNPDAPKLPRELASTSCSTKTKWWKNYSEVLGANITKLQHNNGDLLMGWQNSRVLNCEQRQYTCQTWCPHDHNITNCNKWLKRWVPIII